MELESLVFNVNTDALATALNRVNSLESSVAALTKAIAALEEQKINSQRNETKLARAEEATLRAKEKLRETEEKLAAAKQKAIDIEQQQIETQEKARKQSEQTGESISEVEKRLEKQRLTLKVLSGDVISFTDSLVQMNRGFTAGQASQLATLKLMGATSDQFKELASGFEQLNKLQGVNPFDKSAGNLQKMKKDTQELTMVNEYLAKNLGLSREQIVGLSRDLEAYKLVANNAGMSQKDIAAGIEKMTAETVIAARELNALKEASKLAEQQAKEHADAENTRALAIQKVADAQRKLTDRIAKEQAMQKYLDGGASRSTANTAASFQVQGVPQDLIDSFVKEANAKEKSAKASRDAATAAAYLASMEDKLTTAVQETNKGLSRQQSDELVKIRQALKLSGASAEETAKKMALFEAALRQAASQDNARSMQHMARAISVQMGDVVTSLASGMNPLLVFIQQGDQIRGAMLNAKGNAEEMNKVMSTAAAQIVSSFAMVAKVFSNFVFGAFTSAGAAIVESGKNLTTWGLTLIANVSGLSKLAGAVDLNSQALQKFEKITGTVVGGALMVLVTMLVAGATSAYKMMKASTEMTNALVENGASIGLTTKELENMARAMEGNGTSARTYINIFTEMAKAGGISANVMRDAAIAAAELEKVGGQSAEESVKKLSDIGKDPVKALSDYRIATGLVTQAQMDHVQQLVEVGKKMEAVQYAQEALSNSMIAQRKIIESELSPIQKLWVDLKSSIDDVWTSIGNLINSPKVLGVLSKALQDVINKAKAFAVGLNSIANGDFLKGVSELGNSLPDIIPGQSFISRFFGTKEEINTAARTSVGVIGMTTKAIQENAKAEEVRSRFRSILDKAKEKDDKQQMSRNDYIIKQLAKLSEMEGRWKSGEKEAVTSMFGKEWDDAHKQKKTPADKEAKSLERFYENIMESARKANDQTEGIFEGMTKLEIQAKKTIDDPRFKKLSGKQQDNYKNSMNEAIDIEKTNLALELKNKLLGDADGLGQEYYKNLALINKLEKEKPGLANWQELKDALYKTTQQSKDFLRIQEERRKYGAEVQKETDSLKQQFDMLSMTAAEQEIANRQLAMRNEYLDAGNKLMQQMADVDMSKMSNTEKEKAKLDFVDQYQKKLDNISLKYQIKELSQFSDSWKLIIEQVDSMGSSLSGAFGKIGTSLANSFKSFGKLGATLDKNKKILNEYKGEEAGRAKLVRKNTIEELGLYAESAGAVKTLFKEKTTAYKALDALEKGLHAARIGMMVAEMAMSKTAVASTTADNAVKAESSIASAGVDAVAGVIKAIASMPFPLNIAAGVATAAVMAGLLSQIGGSMGGIGGGGSSSAPTYNTGTGTVFGDSSAKSESLTKTTSLLEQANSLTQKYSPQMLRHLRNIDNSIGGLVNLMVRTGNLNTGEIKQSSQYYGVGSFVDKVVAPVRDTVAKILPVVGAGDAKLVNTLIGGLFGKVKYSVVGSGITGNAQSVGSILSNGFDASYFSDIAIKKKSWFGSSTKYKTVFTEADAQLEQQITAVFKGIADSLVLAGKSLGGVESDIVSELNNFVVDIGKVNLSGSASDMQETLTNVFSAISDEMAKKIVPGLEEFQKVGEGYFETLVRVASNLEQVNSWMDMLGSNLLQLGTNGVRASESLISLFGGLDEFSSATSDYYDKFYTEEEKNAKKREQLTRAFASMGMSVPATTKEYKDLVNSLDLTTSTGAEMYYTMIKVSDAFYQVKNAGEEAAKSLKDSVYEAFTSAVDTQKTSLDKLKSEYENNVNNLKTIFDNLDGYIKELRGVSATANVAEAKKLIAEAISTGNLPDSNSISDAYNTLKNNLSSTNYGSAFEKNKAYGLLANDLEALQKVAGTKLTDQQLLLDGVNKQIAALDAQLEYAKKQYNLLSNINDSVVGVGIAFDAMMEVFRKQAALQGISLDPVPAFASGGSYNGGLALVGETGPELINFNQPGQVYNANQTSKILNSDNSEVVEAITNLNNNLELLRVEIRADVSHNAKVAKLLDRVISDGESVLVTVKT